MSLDTGLTSTQIFRGNRLGVLRYHLQAARHFARTVFATSTTPQNEDLARVLVEMYAHLELISSLHLSSSSEDAQSVLQCAISILESVRHHATFGTMFGSAVSLYEMIPHIRGLAVARKRELLFDLDLKCKSEYNTLRERLLNFDWNAALATGPSSSQADFLLGKAAAGRLVQYALLMFLDSAYHKDNALLRQMARPIVDSAFEALDTIDGTLWKNAIYWPTVVIGSYACTDEQKERIMRQLTTRLQLTARAQEVLQWLWHGPDDLFGLDGVAQVIDEHRTYYCFG